jgi:serine/threonine protein kinase
MSPEYVMEGAFSVKSDTYSFGVLLLEMVSGLKISSPHRIEGFSNLIEYVSMLRIKTISPCLRWIIVKVVFLFRHGIYGEMAT